MLVSRIDHFAASQKEGALSELWFKSKIIHNVISFLLFALVFSSVPVCHHCLFLTSDDDNKQCAIQSHYDPKDIMFDKK
jgi:hypothetical protein